MTRGAGDDVLVPAAVTAAAAAALGAQIQ